MHDIRIGEKWHQDRDALHVVLEIAEMDGVILIFHHKLFNIHAPLRFAFAITEYEYKKINKIIIIGGNSIGTNAYTQKRTGGF